MCRRFVGVSVFSGAVAVRVFARASFSTRVFNGDSNVGVQVFDRV